MNLDLEQKMLGLNALGTLKTQADTSLEKALKFLQV